MNLIRTTLSLQMALLAIALAAPGPVQSARRPPPSHSTTFRPK